MDSKRAISITRPDTEGGGCYGCNLHGTCAAFRELDQMVTERQRVFFNFDAHPSRWQELFLVLAEVCIHYESSVKTQEDSPCE